MYWEINKSYRQYTKSYRDLKIYSLIDKLVKMLVLKIFITGDVCPFGLASFTDEPWDWAKQLSKACYWKLFCIELLELSLVILRLPYIFGRKKIVSWSG